MQTGFRYISDAEMASIRVRAEVRSLSGYTWFACSPPSFYQTAAEVRERLAVSDLREFSIGPIPADEAPEWDHVPPRTVAPQQLADGTWVPGGGTEAATTQAFLPFNFRRLA